MKTAKQKNNHVSCNSQLAKNLFLLSLTERVTSSDTKLESDVSLLQEYKQMLLIVEQTDRVTEIINTIQDVREDLLLYKEIVASKFPELKELNRGISNALNKLDSEQKEMNRRAATVVGKVANKVPYLKGLSTGLKTAAKGASLGGILGTIFSSTEYTKPLIREATAVRLTGMNTLSPDLLRELISSGVINSQGVVNLRRYAEVVNTLGSGNTFGPGGLPYLDSTLLGPYAGRNFEVVNVPNAVRRAVAAIHTKHPEIMNKAAELFSDIVPLKPATAMKVAGSAAGKTGLVGKSWLSFLLSPTAIGALIGAGVGAATIYGLISYISGRMKEIEKVVRFYNSLAQLNLNLDSVGNELINAKTSKNPDEVARIKNSLMSSMNLKDTIWFMKSGLAINEILNLPEDRLKEFITSKEVDSATDENTTPASNMTGEVASIVNSIH